MESQALVQTLQLPFVELLQEVLHVDSVAGLLLIQEMANIDLNFVAGCRNGQIFVDEALPCLLEKRIQVHFGVNSDVVLSNYFGDRVDHVGDYQKRSCYFAGTY